jgi:hypothetical protein
MNELEIPDINIRYFAVRIPRSQGIIPGKSRLPAAVKFSVLQPAQP